MHIRGALQIVVRRPNLQVVDEEIDHGHFVSLDCVSKNGVAVAALFVKVLGIVNRPLAKLVVLHAVKMIHGCVSVRICVDV